MTDRKLKLSAVFIFEIKAPKRTKFLIFKGPFLRNGWPMDMIFDVFSETYVRLLKSITLEFYPRYNKSYNNLNVKSCLKVNGLNKKTSHVGAAKLYVTNTTL